MASGEGSVRASDNCFDFIRLIAAISVVIAHGVRHLEAPFLFVPAHTDLFHKGVEGVKVFFVLSGMLVFMSALRCLELARPIRSFFANRFLRVAPAIYVYAVVSTLVLVGIGALALKQVVTKTYLAWFFGNFILYPLYFPPEHRHIGVGIFNGSLWTIPVEVSYYLIVPGLAWLWLKGKKKLMWALLTVAVLAATVLTFGIEHFHPGWFDDSVDPPLWWKVYIAALPPWLYWFGLGIAWYQMWKKAPQGIGWFFGAMAAYLLIGFVFYDALAPLGVLREVIYGVPLSYAVVWFGFKGPKVLRDMSKIGDLSYGVYVWHMVVVNLMLYTGLYRSIPNPLVVPAALAITLVLAWISWWIVEKPSLRRKPYSSRTS